MRCEFDGLRGWRCPEPAVWMVYHRTRFHLPENQIRCCEKHSIDTRWNFTRREQLEPADQLELAVGV